MTTPEAAPSAGAARPDQSDRHAWLFQVCDLAARRRAWTAGQTYLWLARLREVTPAGVHLLLDRPLPAGAALEVQLERRGGGVSPPVPVRVAGSARRGDSEYHVECEFLRPPGLIELLELLV